MLPGKTVDLIVETPGGERIDRYLARAVPEWSRSFLQKLIAEERVTMGGLPVRASRKAAAGERIRIEVPAPSPAEAGPEDIPLSVLYEDPWLLAVDKPRGLVVHPAPGHSSGTLVNALLHRCGDLSGVGGVVRPGIVHRLDKDTSGVIVVAKDDRTHRALQALFKERTVEKVYLAVVVGRLDGEGTVDRPVGRHAVDRKKMAADAPRGRPAITHWRAIEPLAGATLLEVRIETGRTHQIRVHLAAIGHPVVGDPLYGGAARARGVADAPARRRLLREKTQALHAWRLAFPHPRDGLPVRLTAPVPEELLSLVEDLGGTRWADRQRREPR